MITRGTQSRRTFLEQISLAAGILALNGRLQLCGASAGKEKDGVPKLGINASLGGKRVFPADNPWNTDISPVGCRSPLPSLGRQYRSGKASAS
jgi:hypothetical protein